ncbi:hypothetical protein CEXT_560181 [Caerostris extrusa]|uniref:WAP domain-containing protein n=1 Tax=Caerostris extrusa TaxID=172846 RepID=A0AAV4YD34_CAEEX|nr:hypothetical protein CEXT_560181 [Caerostris extrusa]
MLSGVKATKIFLPKLPFREKVDEISPHAQLDIFTTAFIQVFCVFHFCCFDLIFLPTLRTSKMKLIIVLLLTVLALSVVQANYCPARSNIQCIRASNQCCCDSDCKDGKICCGENCGNACKSPVCHPTSGTRVRPSSTCQIDPFLKPQN